MIIQFKSAHNINANEEMQAPIIDLLTENLDRFDQHITRLDVHLSDENGNKDGMADKRCLLEAHIEGKEPLIAKDHAGSYEQAADGASEKLKGLLNTLHSRLGDHHQ